MPLAVLDIEELLEVLTDRTKPSRVLDQFLLSDIWAKLPKIRKRPVFDALRLPAPLASEGR